MTSTVDATTHQSEPVAAPELKEPAMSKPQNVVVGHGLAEKVAAVLGCDPETLRPVTRRAGR